ncbi:MAG TPA: hypothetical protein PK443_00510 [bacterium]|nr:hypothetical protein [bacterium]
MLAEFILIMVISVPLVFGGLVFSKKIDERFFLEDKMRQGVYELFFNGSCYDDLVCSKDSIQVKQLYSIKIRQPNKAFYIDKKETENETFSRLYKELETAIKGSPKQ